MQGVQYWEVETETQPSESSEVEYSRDTYVYSTYTCNCSCRTQASHSTHCCDCSLKVRCGMYCTYSFHNKTLKDTPTPHNSIHTPPITNAYVYVHIYCTYANQFSCPFAVLHLDLWLHIQYVLYIQARTYVYREHY